MSSRYDELERLQIASRPSRAKSNRGGGSPFDIGFQSISGYCVSNATISGGGSAKVDSSGSSGNC